MFYLTDYLSPLCPVTIASDGENIVGLWLEGQKYYGATIGGETVRQNDLPVFSLAVDWLDRYFAGQNPPIEKLSLAPAGSDFRRAVWDILCGIPYGQCITYRDIAIRVAAKMNQQTMSAQAVGGAVGHNPISIIIPCHRVIGSNGSLTGYAGGIDKKFKLLEHEGFDISRLSVPSHGTAL